jgi:DNA-binding CsgD family transcriptional regulator
MSPLSSTLNQLTLDVIQNPFVIKNDFGVIMSCNQAFKNLNSLDDRVLGMTAYDFLSQKEADIHTQSDIALLAATDSHSDYRITRDAQDGTKLTLNVHKSLSHTEEGHKEIVVVINNQPQACGARNNHLLSPRESSALELLVQGNTQKQIAISLGISHHTVADYLKAIYCKLGVNSRTQAQLKGIAELGIGVK